MILIGTPGSGKTWVGEVLARRKGLCFLDLEGMLLARYGSTAEFIADKPRALEWFEERVRVCVAEQDRTVVFEVGAFSQRDTIRRLRSEFDTVLVLVEAASPLRRRRIETRERGRNLIEDADESMTYDGVFETELRPTFDFTFRIENDNLAETELVRVVEAALHANSLALHPP